MRFSTIASLSLSASLLLLLPACAPADGADSGDDQLGADSADQPDSGKADAPGEYTFYRFTKKRTTCTGSTCATASVSRPNRSTSKCADGSTKASCDVVAIDWSASGISAATQQALLTDAPFADDDTTNLIIKGSLEMRALSNSATKVPYLVVTQAWKGLEQPATGILALVVNSHEACTGSSCKPMRANKLNSTVTSLIGDVDFADASISASAESSDRAAIATGPGVIVAGTQYTIHSGDYGRLANNVFTEVAAAAPQPTSCPLLTETCPTGCCSIGSVQVSTSGDDPAIAVDSKGDIFEAYSDSSSKVYLAAYNATANHWTTTALGTGSYIRNRVLVDKQDRVHVLTGPAAFAGQQPLTYRRSDDGGATFAVTTVIGMMGEDVLYNFDMALDSGDNPNVAYSAGNNELIHIFASGVVFTKFDGTKWTSTSIDTNSSGDDYLSLQLGFADRPHVIFQGKLGVTNLIAQPGKRHVYFNGNAWVTENIELLSTNDHYPDNALINNDFHVNADDSIDYFFSRLNGTATTLTHAHRTTGAAGTWTETDIAGGASLSYASMFIDETGAYAFVSDGLKLSHLSANNVLTNQALSIVGGDAAVVRQGDALFVGYGGNGLEVTRIDLNATN